MKYVSSKIENGVACFTIDKNVSAVGGSTAGPANESTQRVLQVTVSGRVQHLDFAFRPMTVTLEDRQERLNRLISEGRLPTAISTSGT